jgi:hypothetical protein
MHLVQMVTVAVLLTMHPLELALTLALLRKHHYQILAVVELLETLQPLLPFLVLLGLLLSVIVKNW